MAWFDLKQPCNDCPFRRSQAPLYRLPEKRLKEIFDATAFECHKTTGVAGDKKEPQQCAGLIALHDAESSPNTITKAAMVLTGYSPNQIDKQDTFGSYKEAQYAHGNAAYHDKET